MSSSPEVEIVEEPTVEKITTKKSLTALMEDEEARLRRKLLMKTAAKRSVTIVQEESSSTSALVTVSDPLPEDEPTGDRPTSPLAPPKPKKDKKKHSPILPPKHGEPGGPVSPSAPADRAVKMDEEEDLDEGISIRPPQAIVKESSHRHKKHHHSSKHKKRSSRDRDDERRSGSSSRHEGRKREDDVGDASKSKRVAEGWARWKESLDRTDKRPSHSRDKDSRHRDREERLTGANSTAVGAGRSSMDPKERGSREGSRSGDTVPGGNSTSASRRPESGAPPRSRRPPPPPGRTRSPPRYSQKREVEEKVSEKKSERAVVLEKRERKGSESKTATSEKEKNTPEVSPMDAEPPKTDTKAEPSEVKEESSGSSSDSNSSSGTESGELSEEETEKKKADGKKKYSKFESTSGEGEESDGDDSLEGLQKNGVDESAARSQEAENSSDEEGGNGTSNVAAGSNANDSPNEEDDIEDDDIIEDDEDDISKLPTYFPGISGCRSVEEFHCLNRIEEGTYGVVYRATEKRSDEVVALKRLKMEKEKEGFPITALREINMLLKAGGHENIVNVREIVVGSNMDKIYLVMDYVHHDMKSLMENMPNPFLIGEVKTLLRQLLAGVHHLHDNWILHRDLKTSNLLLSHDAQLKIGDFGLAREYGSPLKPYTPVVVTLWYRAPELLLGAPQYSTMIDMWSVGCIFGEFLTLKPLMPGRGDMDQLNRIFKLLGSPNEEIWPGYSKLPAVKRCNFHEYKYNQLRKHFDSSLSDNGFKLINKFLTYDPSRRINAMDALRHPWFEEIPTPVPREMFPTWPAKSELKKAPPKKTDASPKAPEGGKQFEKEMGNDDDEGLFAGLQIKPNQAKGFSLKFDAPKF